MKYNKCKENCFKKSLTIHIIFISSVCNIQAQDFWDDWDSNRVDETYVKQDLPYGALDEDGDDIDYIFVKSELKAGTYEVEIEDESGDLYHIKGTKYYLTFLGYMGYVGYGQEGVLEISAYGGGYFYKKP